jgi:hypothetical protein
VRKRDSKDRIGRPSPGRQRPIQELLQERLSRCEQFLRIPVELNPAVVKHHELGMRSLHVVKTHNLDSSVLAHGPCVAMKNASRI